MATACQRWAAVAFFGLVTLSCTQSEEASKPDGTPIVKPNIVLIVIDTLRADHLTTYGYTRDTAPQIEALSRESLVFDNAVTVMGLTLPAHASIMTGLHPRTHGTQSNFQVFSPTSPTLAERLRSDGYTTAAFVSGLPLTRRSGLDRGFDIYEDTRNQNGKDAARVPGEKTTRRAISWLDEPRQQDHPFFLFVHYYDTHMQYVLPDSHEATFEVDATLEETIRSRDLTGLVMSDLLYAPVLENRLPLDLPQAINAYDNQIRRVDGLVGQIVTALRKNHQLDNSLLIITSDHGEGLGQHAYYEHQLHLYEEQLRIPLVIRPPASSGERPRRIAELASLVDIMPTVLEWSGHPVPAKTQGQDLRRLAHVGEEAADRWVAACRPPFGTEAKEGTDGRFSSKTHLCVLRGDGSKKYLRHGGGREELYDLKSDPQERFNRAGTHPKEIGPMRSRLKRLLAQTTSQANTSGQVSEEQKKALEALGYAE